jgi:hypothetical protein
MIGNFVWGDGGKAITPDEAKRRREIAMAMIQQGTANRPIQHWAQGAANVAQALMGAYDMRQTDKQEAAAREASKAQDAALLSAMGGGATAAAPAMAPQGGGQAAPVPPPQDGVRASPDMFRMIEEQNAQAGLPPGYLTRTAQIESGMNPSAKNPNSSATGLFQFIDSTRKQYGGFDPMDPAASTQAAARLASDNRAALVKALGREPNAGELYLAHQQGAGGASKLLANPNARAVDLLGANAVRLNGGDENMTAGQFASKWTGKFGDGASPAAPQAAPVTPVQQVAQANPQLLQAAMARMNDPYAPPGSRAVAQALVQRLVTQETKDPRDSRLKDLSIAEKEAALTNQSQMTPLQRRQAELAVQKSERELAGEGASPLTPEERKSIGIPEGQPAYKTRSGEIKFGPAGTRVNVDASQKTESEFGKETGKALAKRFDQLASDGDEAAQNLELVGEMRRLGGRIDTGAGAAVKSYLGKIGVKTEGVSDIEAFNTLINRLTPQQRVPGSGATSDFDAKMFRESLPSLMNTPEGNAKILETIERISTNKIARGEVAMRVQMGELTPKQGLDEIRKLQAEARSISDQFKPAQKQQSPGNLAPSTSEPGKVLRYNPQTGEFE